MLRSLILSVFLVLTGLVIVLAWSRRPAAIETSTSSAVTRPASLGHADRVRGMTVSCQTWGWEWGTDEMVATMKTLRELGVNWITIHPYAHIQRDGTVRSSRIDADDPPEWITRPIREAHDLGLKMMIKPHLAYWGSGFEWRGDIVFETEEEWGRFFTGYREWIVDLARISAGAGADAFVIGAELDQTLDRENEWRTTIAEVREVNDGPLTYAANWNTWEQAPFWDALDIVGIQAYFPLLEGSVIGAEPTPNEAALEQGWTRVMTDLHRFHQRTGKHIIFTELGYTCSSQAPWEPWNEENGGENAAEVQQRCLNAALSAIANEPAVVGAFLWKWFPGDRRARNFDMAAPEIRRVIASHWR